jgi:hypothetical protein
MTVDKTVLKKMIDSAKPNDLIVATVSSLDKNSQKKVKAELDKFMIKSTDYVITIVRK